MQKVTIGETNTIGILETEDLAHLNGVAGVAGWRVEIPDIGPAMVSQPDWMMVFESTEALRGVTLALIGICSSMGINPEGPH